LLLAKMDAEFGAAVSEIRALAHGMVPPDPTVECAVYFSCVEALQNVAKHAGPGAVTRLRLCRTGEAIRFSVEDSGRGSPQDLPALAGHGLRNISERLSAVGGRVEVAAAGATGGLRVSGEAPHGTPTAEVQLSANCRRRDRSGQQTR
jgi:glucose-6-phosphate-specific signal transduction histidine kinase